MEKTAHPRPLKTVANSGATPFTDSGDTRSLKVQHF
jgi:hypothetical protein